MRASSEGEKEKKEKPQKYSFCAIVSTHTAHDMRRFCDNAALLKVPMQYYTHSLNKKPYHPKFVSYSPNNKGTLSKTLVW